MKNTYSLDMKKTYIALVILAIVVAITSTSCASQKQGCPGNPQANYKFRG